MSADAFKEHRVRPTGFIDNLVNRPDKEILGDQIRDDYNCIRTPEEYQAAFERRASRCVSKDLIGRVSQGLTVGTSTFNGTQKSAYFFTNSDGLAKYLRIGFPQTLGDYLPSDNVSLTDPAFPGLVDISSGQALLEALGYGVTEIQINNVFVLNIFSRSALKDALRSRENTDHFPFHANINGIIPSWRNLRDYFEYIFADSVTNPPLKISDQAIQILEETDFDNLTGCPTACTYAAGTFPGGYYPNQLAYTQTRVNSQDCPNPKNMNDMQIAPSSFETGSEFCDKSWVTKYNVMRSYFTPFFVQGIGCTPDNELGSAKLLAANLANTTDPTEQALWFRAFLIQGCNGNFNPLFSGNGYTYTGTGGLLAGLSSELIVSPFLVDLLPSKSYVSIPFCVNGLNGGQPTSSGPNGTCPLPPQPLQVRA